MRGLQSCASLFVITESCIREELSFLNRVRKFTASAIGNASNKGDEGGRKGRTQELLEALTPSEAKVTASESELEEASKRAKDYSRQKMRQHRQWQAEFMTKVKLRDAAVAALPNSLREAALVPDLTLFPSMRQVWTETPPHEQGDTKIVQQDDTDKRKRKIGTKM